MNNIANTALGGMTAAVKKYEVSARNVVNQGTVGTPGAESAGKAYEAVEAIQTSGPGGTPEVKVREKNPSTVQAYAPSNPLANEEGLIEIPNVDLADEIVNQNLAVQNYKASIKVFEVWNDMQNTVLDIKT
jgi:flagellar basal-body rod protein FlgC